MNSTSIFGFLNPIAKTASLAKQATVELAANYVDRIIAAIRLTTELDNTGATPSTDDLAVLKGFFGYGKAAKAFEKKHERYTELKDSFETEKDYATARKGVLHSYFTPDFIVRAMWRTVCRLGLTEGRVLEPSCGSGQFIHLADPSFSGRFVGVELDPTVGSIARHLNPKAKIYINQRLEHAKIPASGDFDLVISNPPFGAIKAHDQRFGNQSIHNYFVLRGLSELREGGLLCFVVSTWVMDKKDEATRRQIAKMANLVASVRLPSNAFQSEGVTLPVDVLIFQKTATPTVNPDWLYTGDHTSGAHINRHYINNPDCILGTVSAPAVMSFNSCEVSATGDLELQLSEALDSLSTSPIYHSPNRSLNIASDVVEVEPQEPVSKFELFSQNETVYQRIDDSTDENGHTKAVFKELTFANRGQEKRTLAYITVKDALKALLEAEQSNQSRLQLAKLREELNLLHDGYVKAFGGLSRTSNKSLLRPCSMYLRVKALEVDFIAENKKEGIKESFNKAQILSKRVYTPFVTVESASSYEEALAICLNESASLSYNRIAELMNVSKDEAKEYCESNSLAFIEPLSGKLTDAASYLSGNVRQKYQDALSACATTYHRNLTALERVIPEDLGAEEITAVMGALWIDEKFYVDFANRLMGENSDFTVTYQADRWHVKAGGHGYWGAASTTWGTNARTFDLLLESGLNGTPITITYTDSTGAKLIDQEATAEANAKLDEIRAEFDDWIWNDAHRREQLLRTYNDKFNSFVVPDYSNLSAKLTLEGCSMSPYDYQKSAIMRGLLNSNVLFDCAVGSGKTLIFQGVANTLKRIHGAAERIAIVMPNALVSQFANTMSSTFPASDVIALEAGLSPSKREELLNTVCTNDFDLLVLPESTFGALSAPIDTLTELIQGEIDDLRKSLEECENKNLNVKRIEKRIEKKEAELEEVINKPRLSSIDWSDLGITTLMCDEQQIFKNVPFSTTYSNVRGMGNPTGSKKAFDFFVKVRDLQKSGGRVLGGTGSSLSNSITETVTWLKIFAPEIANTGLHRTDAFLRQFSNPITEYSLAATGRTLKSTTTIKQFQNLSELLAIYRTFAEVLSSEQLTNRLPTLPDGRPAIPPLKNGKVTNIILPISDAQDEEFERIVFDAKHIDNKDNNMLAIIDRARKTSLDIRHIRPHEYNTHSVVNAACENIINIHNQVKHFNGTQLVFCDRSCPARHKAGAMKEFREKMKLAESGDLDAIAYVDNIEKAGGMESLLANSFSVYDEAERILSENGLRVAVVHDFKTDIQKAKLKADFNAGRYDCLLGSTSKLGTGWNLNERLVANHNIDLPLRPGDLEQRNGRILRQSNKAYFQGFIKEVEIFTYCTEKTLDSWFTSLLDRKAKFIAQFNNGTLDTREYESEDEKIDFATLSALVSGDTRLMDLVKAQQELKRLNLLARSHKRKVFRLQDDQAYYTHIVDSCTLAMSSYEADAKNATGLTPLNLKIGNTSIALDIKPLESAIKTLQKQSYYSRTGDEQPLCDYGSFKVIAIKGKRSGWNIVVRGAADHDVCTTSQIENASGRRVYNRLTEHLDTLKDVAIVATKRIAYANKQLTLVAQELAKPFKHELALTGLKQTIHDLELELANEKQKQAA